MSVKEGFYQHYKGNVYLVLAVGKHSETTEDLVVYKAMYDSSYGFGAIWCRPVAMFLEEVAPGIPRFKKIAEDEASAIINGG